MSFSTGTCQFRNRGMGAGSFNRGDILRMHLSQCPAFFLKKPIGTKRVYLLIAAILVIGLFLLYMKQARQEKISGFGKYQGYSEAMYDGTKRISDYVTLSNGTRLAYDLILPTKKGIPVSGPGMMPSCRGLVIEWRRAGEMRSCLIRIGSRNLRSPFRLRPS